MAPKIRTWRKRLLTDGEIRKHLNPDAFDKIRAIHEGGIKTAMGLLGDAAPGVRMEAADRIFHMSGREALGLLQKAHRKEINSTARKFIKKRIDELERTSH